MRYRRAWTRGGMFFFTVNLNDRRRTLLVEYADTLRHAFQIVRVRHPFHIDAIVILPDHLHAILTLPDSGPDFATRWSLIKANFSRAFPRDEDISESQLSEDERGIWQRRFWEYQIRDDKDMERHIDYIHWNPMSRVCC